MCSPLLPTAVPYAAEDLHTHCTAIHDKSLLLSPWELGGSVDTQALCQRPDHPMAVSPVPRVMLLSFSPLSPWSQRREGWRLPVLLEGHGMAGWCSACTLCPCGCEARVLVCTDCTGESPVLCPRLVLGMCHPLPRSTVNPDALSLCSESWTVSVTGRLSGHLASSLLPGGRALAHRSLPALTAFCPCHLGLALSPFPLCPSFLLGHTGWWVTWRALGQAGL